MRNSKEILNSMKRKYQGSTKVKHSQLLALHYDLEALSMKEGESVNGTLQEP